jgi:hypothetical protein
MAWPAAAALAQDKAVAPTTAPTAMKVVETKTVEAKAPEKCNCIFCQGKQALKESAPWLDVFADARLREVSTPNMLLDKEDRNFQRFRERVGVTVKPCEWFEAGTRLVYEPRHFCQPDSRQAFTRNAAYIDEWTMNEAIVDLAYVKFKKPFGLPVTATIGRQEIILGDGWLVLDGTPLDGSRTIFFDAARFTTELEACKTKVDLIYIQQYADSDQWLPPICDKDFHNIEQDEKGVILYVSNKSLKDTQIDGYFIYKHDEQVIGHEPGDVGSPRSAPWQCGDNADIYTLGTRVMHNFDEHWQARGEGAVQFGSKSKAVGVSGGTTVNDRENLCAFGINTRLTYFFRDELKNEVHVGYEFLSGDEHSGDGENGQFDPLWGRWPQWSELYVYTVGLENRPGETTNFHRLNAGWSCVPCDKITLAADYHALFAHHNSYDNFARVTSADPTKRYFTDDGNFRGHLLTGKLTYKFNQHISGHLLAELFFPGNFYNDERNEVAGFFRYELTFTW